MKLWTQLATVCTAALFVACGGVDQQAVADYMSKLEAVYTKAGGSMSVDASDKDGTVKTADESIAKIDAATKEIDGLAPPKGGEALKAAVLKNLAAAKASISAFRDEVKGGGDITKAFEKLQGDKGAREKTFQDEQRAALKAVGIQTN